MPRRRQAGSTQTVPIQPTLPLTLRTLVPTTPPSASATNGRVSGWAVTNSRFLRRSPQSSRRKAAATGVDVGRRHRADARGGHGPIVSAPEARDPRLPAASPVSSAHGHPVPLGRRTRRPSRASRAHRCRADEARGRAQPHPRPVRDPGRAADGRHRPDGADDRAREHPSRGRRRDRRCRSRRCLPTRPPATATSSWSRRSSTNGDRSDPTPRPRDGRAPAGRRRLVARADRGPSRGGGARQPRAQRVAHDRPRTCPGRGRRRRRPPGGRPDRPGPRARHAATAAGHPDRAQGSRVRGGRPVHRGLAHPRGLPGAVRRAHHRAAARGRRGHPGQDQHGRVRDGLVDRAFGLRPDRQPVGARPRPGRQQRRLGSRRRRVPRAGRDRHRHRRLDPPARGAVRDRRHEADLRPGQPLRDRRLRELARPDRAVRPRRPRRRGAAPRRGRARRPRFRPRRPSRSRRR